VGFVDFSWQFFGQVFKSFRFALGQVFPYIVVHEFVFSSVAMLTNFSRTHVTEIIPTFQFQHFFARIVLLRERFGEAKMFLLLGGLLELLETRIFELFG